MYRKALPPGVAIEGIILSSIPFEETSSIVNLFSKEFGRIKVVIKQSGRKRLQSFKQLLGIEALVVPSDKELWKCRECEVVRSYPQLRMRLDRLQSAALLSDLLTKILPLALPMPPIYTLFSQILEQIPRFAHPDVAAAAFLAKFCMHEGLSPIEMLDTEEMQKYMFLAANNLENLVTESIDPMLVTKLAQFLLI